MTVTKHDIIETVINRIGFSRKQSTECIESLIEIMKTSLETEDNVLVSGFGKFSVKKKKERKGRNPATGETMMLRERKVVTFQHSVKLKNGLNR